MKTQAELQTISEEIELALCEAAGPNKAVFDPQDAVEVIHDDGSRFLFQSAKVLYRDEHYFVFTEHHGTSFYHKDDVYVYFYRRGPLQQI
jgi:hypothetical protein